MRKLILKNVLFLLTAMLGYQTEAQTLVLHHVNGTTIDVQLFTKPKVVFQDNKVVVISSVLDMEYPKDEILGFTYKGNLSGISNPAKEVDDNICKEENNELVFHHIKPSEKISVYKTNGLCVPVRITRRGDDATLPLNALPKGVYLLSVNGRTSKFTKR